MRCAFFCKMWQKWFPVVSLAPSWIFRFSWTSNPSRSRLRSRSFVERALFVLLALAQEQELRQLWQASAEKMADVRKISACFADPTIFDVHDTALVDTGRPAERAKSINEL